jgi:hypothetical protein
MRVNNSLWSSSASRGGDDKGIAGFNSSAIEVIFDSSGIDEAGWCKRSEEGVSSVRRNARIERHCGVASLPHPHEGVNEALAGLSDRHEFLHRE